MHYVNNCNLFDESVDLGNQIKIKVFKKDVEVTVNKIRTISCSGDTNFYNLAFESDKAVKLLDKLGNCIAKGSSKEN